MNTIRFSNRSHQVEHMDELDISGPVVFRTLKELDSINQWLGGNQVTLRGCQKLISASDRPIIHIADLGCGSGSMLMLLAQWGRRHQLNLKLTGIDANPHIISYARENTREFPEIEFISADILEGSFEQLRFDLITSTLFTHHFNNQQLSELIARWRQQASMGIVINDLHRHRVAYYSIKLITKWISKSAMVKNDAPISVLRGFRKQELKDLLEQCGVEDFQLSWHWAFRWLLVIPTGN